MKKKNTNQKKKFEKKEYFDLDIDWDPQYYKLR